MRRAASGHPAPGERTAGLGRAETELTEFAEVVWNDSVVDVNGNGYSDLIPGRRSGLSTLSLLYGGAAQLTWAPDEVEIGVRTSGDVNGDGLGDLVGTRRGPAALTLQLGSAGGLAPATTLMTPSRAAALSIADLDGNGYADVVTVPYTTFGRGGAAQLVICRGGADGVVADRVSTIDLGTA